MFFMGSRSAEGGGVPPTLALAGDQGKPHANSAEQPGRHFDSPHRRAPGADLTASSPSRLQRVVGRHQVAKQSDGMAALILADSSWFDADGHTVVAGHTLRCHIDLLDAFAVLPHVVRVSIDRRCGLVK